MKAKLLYFHVSLPFFLQWVQHIKEKRGKRQQQNNKLTTKSVEQCNDCNYSKVER